MPTRNLKTIQIIPVVQLILILLISCNQNQNQKPEAIKPLAVKKNNPISSVQQSDIRKIDSIIQYCDSNINMWKIDSLDLADLNLSTDGGKAIFYSNNGNLLSSIYSELYGETWNSKLHFYYKNDFLVFAKEDIEKYNVPYYMDSAKAVQENSEAFDPLKSNMTIKKYYFLNNELCKLLYNGKDIPKDSILFQEESKDIKSLNDTLKIHFNKQ